MNKFFSYLAIIEIMIGIILILLLRLVLTWFLKVIILFFVAVVGVVLWLFEFYLLNQIHLPVLTYLVLVNLL